MANALYDLGRQKFLEGSIAYLTDSIEVFLVDSASYTPNLATDEFLSAVATAARKGNSGGSTRADSPALATKTSTAGTADAADTTITSVPAGSALEYILLYKDDGVADTSSPLIALIDTAMGLPVTPNGANITIVWDAAGIFTL